MIVVGLRQLTFQYLILVKFTLQCNLICQKLQVILNNSLWCKSACNFFPICMQLMFIECIFGQINEKQHTIKMTRNPRKSRKSKAYKNKMKEIQNLRKDGIYFDDTHVQKMSNLYNLDIVLFAINNSPMEFMDTLLTPFGADVTKSRQTLFLINHILYCKPHNE